MTWVVPVLVMAAMGLLCLYVTSSLADDLAKERAWKIDAVTRLSNLVYATALIEPKRPDADDPLRERLVFCGRWVEQGHAPDCPWVAAVSATFTLEPA